MLYKEGQEHHGGCNGGEILEIVTINATAVGRYGHLQKKSIGRASDLLVTRCSIVIKPIGSSSISVNLVCIASLRSDVSDYISRNSRNTNRTQRHLCNWHLHLKRTHSNNCIDTLWPAGRQASKCMPGSAQKSATRTKEVLDICELYQSASDRLRSKPWPQVSYLA